MASLDELAASSFTKLIVVGDGGSGKTGALASLVLDGYNLKIADFDAGTQVLASILRAKNPALLKNVEVEVFKNKLKAGADGKVRLQGAADALGRSMKKLTEWSGTCGPKDVIVLDSLTFMGKVAMDYILQLTSREEKPEIQDWGAAMALCEKAVALLMSDAVATNVVMNTHINWTEGEGGGVVRGYPNVLGNKLSPIIGTYFNTVLVLKTTGSGESRKREFATRGSALIEGKCSVVNAPATLPHETGLADFFRLARGIPLAPQTGVKK